MLQRQKGRRWQTLAAKTTVVSHACTCSWSYIPATKGRYHLRATIAKRASQAAVASGWLTLHVREG